MKRYFLLSALAVAVTEGMLGLLFSNGSPSRIFLEYPNIAFNYMLVFPLSLILALVAIRWIGREGPPFLSLPGGFVAGLILGPIAFTLAQILDPVERVRLLHGIDHFGIGQILLSQFFMAPWMTLSALHGSIAGLLFCVFDFYLLSGGRTLK